MTNPFGDIDTFHKACDQEPSVENYAMYLDLITEEYEELKEALIAMLFWGVYFIFVAKLLETIDIVQRRFNEKLEILGVLLTFVENRTKLSRQVQRQMREHFGELVFDTVIHKDVRLAEAPSAHEPVFIYAPESTGAREHKILAEEIG